MFLLFVVSLSAIAQDVIKETKTTTDSASGQTTKTYSTTVMTSEDITPRNDMIVINPLKFFLFYNLSYFHALSPSLAIGGGFQIPTLPGLDGYGINAELRFYPSKHALRGFYLAPNLSFNSLSGGDEAISTTSVGVLVGWQWFPGDDFAMGLGIGVDRYFTSGAGRDNLFGDYSGTTPALRFDIGFAW
jgi:hypothetical protein